MKLAVLTNPFMKFSENTLFGTGALTFAAGCAIAYYTQFSFDGLIDAHANPDASWGSVFKENSINVGVITLLLFAFGKIINPKTRFIDILNAALIFRIPFYFMPLLSNFSFMKTLENEVQKNINHLDKLNLNPVDMIGVLLVSVLILLLLIYAIWILFIGFKTAANSKKTIHIFLFAVLIILAEITTKYLIFLN
ncbi:hypothetical protein [Flavobacterium sp. XGLA_31]|uniref:hypothetical protein n=1 Tax=Flavobacterium sp. XGLA_31 TaxID=3447666 RepID=UPI003F3FFA80